MSYLRDRSVACGRCRRMPDEQPWWCQCPDRKGPHVHFPNWGGQGGSVCLTALVDIETGREIPGSRKAGYG